MQVGQMAAKGGLFLKKLKTSGSDRFGNCRYCVYFHVRAIGALKLLDIPDTDVQFLG